MTQVLTMNTRFVAPDTHALQTWAPVPGYGVLPVNAYVIKSRQPVLVDTSFAAMHGDFMRELHAAIEPRELRWIWITHADADHVGNLRAVLEVAPNARIVTNFLGMAKLGLQQFPLDRVYLLNPGQTLDIGDRKLAAFRPPSYDAPETMGLFDTRTRALFTSDCFGALLPRPVDTATELAAGELRAGIASWAAIDMPWLSNVDPSRLTDALLAVQDFGPSTVLGSHLPPVDGRIETLFDSLLAAREAPAFIGPDQAALEEMMRMPEAA